MWLLVAEASIVGVVLAAVMALIKVSVPWLLSTPALTALTGFMVGAAFHLAFEAAGLNKAYCSTGHACTA